MTANIPPVKDSAKHAWLALLIVSRASDSESQIKDPDLFQSGRSSGSSMSSGWPSSLVSTDRSRRADY